MLKKLFSEISSRQCVRRGLALGGSLMLIARFGYDYEHRAASKPLGAPPAFHSAPVREADTNAPPPAALPPPPSDGGQDSYIVSSPLREEPPGI